VTSRHHGKGLSRRALAGELRRRGVDGELVGAALEEVDPDTEAATRRALIDRSCAACPLAARRRRLPPPGRPAGPQGYPPGLAITVVRGKRSPSGDSDADLIDLDAMPDLVGETDDPIR